MGVVYGNRSDDALYASVVALAGLVLTVVAATNDRLTVVSRVWIAVVLVGVTAVFVVRSLRRGLTVDHAGATIRGVLRTQFVPWAQVSALGFPDADTCSLVRYGEQEPVLITARVEAGDRPLAETCRELWSAHHERPVRAEPYPRLGYLRVAMGVCAIAILVGPVIVLEAVRDEERYDARAARDRRGVAIVTDVAVEEHDSGEGGTSYTTVVDAVLHLDDERVVDVHMERSGDRGSDYREEAPIAVVYDAAHPRDADFRDRPSRIDQDQDVRGRELVGPLLFLGGVIGVFVVAATMRRDWEQHP